MEPLFFGGKPCRFAELLTRYRSPGSVYTLVRVDFGKLGQVNFEMVRHLLGEILAQQKTGHCLAASREYAAVLYVLEPVSRERQIEQLDTFLRHLEQSMQDYFNLSVTVTAGPAFHDLEEFESQWDEVIRRAEKGGASCFRKSSLLPSESLLPSNMYGSIFLKT